MACKACHVSSVPDNRLCRGLSKMHIGSIWARYLIQPMYYVLRRHEEVFHRTFANSRGSFLTLSKEELKNTDQISYYFVTHVPCRLFIEHLTATDGSGKVDSEKGDPASASRSTKRPILLMAIAATRSNGLKLRKTASCGGTHEPGISMCRKI